MVVASSFTTASRGHKRRIDLILQSDRLCQREARTMEVDTDTDTDTQKLDCVNKMIARCVTRATSRSPQSSVISQSSVRGYKRIILRVQAYDN